MISFVKGQVINKNKNKIVVETSGGIGYEIELTILHSAKIKLNDLVSVITYLKTSENSNQLFGFENWPEKDFFELLMTVSGVGPKTALNILSLGSIQNIQSAIGRGDVKYLTAVSGLGKKTAERLVVELKNKIQNSVEEKESGEVMGEVIDVLVAMGYSKEDVKAAFVGVDMVNKTTEELLPVILKKM